MPRTRTRRPSAIRILAAGLAATALSVAGGIAVAAPTPSPEATVPGPKQPIEHLGLSGAAFRTVTGKPGCYTGAGTLATSFPVPRGAQVTGVTAYLIDGSSTAGLGVTLYRHSLVTGASHYLGSAATSGAPNTTTLTVEVATGGLLTEPSSVNLDVTVGDGVCFKGAEVHFIRNGAAATATPPTTARAPEPTATAVRPDGSGDR